LAEGIESPGRSFIPMGNDGRLREWPEFSSRRKAGQH
jgi:hypothetical protein